MKCIQLKRFLSLLLLLVFPTTRLVENDRSCNFCQLSVTTFDIKLIPFIQKYTPCRQMSYCTADYIYTAIFDWLLIFCCFRCDNAQQSTKTYRFHLPSVECIGEWRCIHQFRTRAYRDSVYKSALAAIRKDAIRSACIRKSTGWLESNAGVGFW